MHRLRLALLVLLLLVPTAALAVPCCDESPGRECCEVEGNCPETPVGECLMAAGPAPIVPIEKWAGAPAIAQAWCPVVVMEASGGPAPSGGPRAGKIPLYLSHRILRN